MTTFRMDKKNNKQQKRG